MVGLGKCVKFKHVSKAKLLGDTSYLLFRGLCLLCVSCILPLDMGIKAAFHVERNLKLLETPGPKREYEEYRMFSKERAT